MRAMVVVFRERQAAVYENIISFDRMRVGRAGPGWLWRPWDDVAFVKGCLYFWAARRRECGLSDLGKWPWRRGVRTGASAGSAV